MKLFNQQEIKKIILQIFPKRKTKPRILLLVDKHKWSFDNAAKKIKHHLKDDFSFQIRYVRDNPRLKAARYDLLFVFFWGEKYYQKFNFNFQRTIKQVSSHRWEDDLRYGPCTPAQFVDKYLKDALVVGCTSQKLFNSISNLHPKVYYTPTGFNPKEFRLIRKRQGQMTVGWAGNINDSVKKVREILFPACQGRFNLLIASGNLPHRKMNSFYNRIDVFAVTSKHEGEPRVLLEAMAAGCFPVCTDVGIVPELIQSGKNGLIVSEHTPEAFRQAFIWCEKNLDKVRRAGEENAQYLYTERRWKVVIPQFKKFFSEALDLARKPRFRNDDVSWDTPLPEFKEFCGIFWKYNLTQVHGITLRGRASTLFRYEKEPTEYEGITPISKLPNWRILELSKDLHFEERHDLIDFLKNNPDEIALHGLYHTDYSQMNFAQQKEDIILGLEILKRLFPIKLVKYFIPPFNRTNKDTYKVCQELNLEVLSDLGIHLESVIDNFTVQSDTWYRYHHHRFYPESTFATYKLSFEILEEALKKIFTPKE